MPRVLVNLLQSTGTKGGIEVYARELYRALGTLDNDFEYVALASSELFAGDTSSFPGRVIDSGISGENRLSWARGELFATSRAAIAQRADLIHGPAMLGPLRPPVPLVLTVHDLLYFSHPELMQTKLFTEPVKWMEKRGAAHATRIVTISEYSGRAIQKYLRYPADRIDVIPLAARENSATRIDGRERRADLFLAMGQRSPYKDFATIVRAWAIMPAEDRPHLVITGGGPGDPLPGLVAELGLGEWIDIREWVSVDELGELLLTATVLIDSTLATGFSLPTVEAMRVGLPVLLCDSEVFREVGGDAADYFLPGSPESLAREVTRLVNDPRRRAELSRRGRDRAAENSWTHVASRTLDSFRAALAEGRR